MENHYTLNYVDAHIHLADNEYSAVVDKVVAESKQANVTAIVSNATDLESSHKTLELAKQYPDHVYAALGIHPWNTKQLKPDELQDTVDLILANKENKNVVAVGEIGLDTNYSGTGEPTQIQQEVFHEMLKVAEQTGLPAVIHSRRTTSQIVELLPSFNIKKVLLHWFSQPHSLIPTIVDRGYYITEGPPTVYSNGMREVIRQIPLTNFMTETDGPVRFSGPFRGQTTTPCFIPQVVEAVAELKNLEETVVADQIYSNFVDFFGVAGVRDKRHDE
jgi:TatD DNase family protein